VGWRELKTREKDEYQVMVEAIYTLIIEEPNPVQSTASLAKKGVHEGRRASTYPHCHQCGLKFDRTQGGHSFVLIKMMQ